MTAALGILRKKGTVFIQKRPPEGLMAHLWEFPGGTLKGKDSPKECLRRELWHKLGVNVNIVKKLAEIRHAYTQYRVSLHAYLCQLTPPDQKIDLSSAVDGRWVSPSELDNYAFPSANRRIIKVLQKNGD